jgi:hypothetical protein
MSEYKIRFISKNKSSLRYYINRQILQQINGVTPENIKNDCASFSCIQTKTNLTKQGYNDPSQSANTRISQILTGPLGGRTTYGNFNRPINIDYLGGWEGQPGGSFKPPRNKF